MKDQTFSRDQPPAAQTANLTLNAFNGSQWKPVQTFCVTSEALKRLVHLSGSIFVNIVSFVNTAVVKLDIWLVVLEDVRGNTDPLITPSSTLFLRSALNAVFSDSLTHLRTIPRLFKDHLIHGACENGKGTFEFGSIGWLSGSQDALDFYQSIRNTPR